MARKVSVTKKIMSSRFFFLSMCGCSFLDVIYSNKIAGFTRVFVSVLKIECWFFASITNQQRIWRETTRRKRGRRGKVKAKFLHRTHTHTRNDLGVHNVRESSDTICGGSEFSSFTSSSYTTKKIATWRKNLIFFLFNEHKCKNSEENKSCEKNTIWSNPKFQQNVSTLSP